MVSVTVPPSVTLSVSFTTVGAAFGATVIINVAVSVAVPSDIV